jgi:hypothetical protein
MEAFKWAPEVVLENLPDSDPVLETFDFGAQIGIAWSWPDGKRTAIKLQSMSRIGGEYVDFEFTVEPDAWIIKRVTRTGLEKTIKEMAKEKNIALH